MVLESPCSRRPTSASLSASRPSVLGSNSFSLNVPRPVRRLATALTAAAVLRSKLGEYGLAGDECQGVESMLLDSTTTPLLARVPSDKSPTSD
jgi:hypothetical protein